VNDKPRISVNCCGAIERLAQSARSYNGSTNSLTAYFNEIVKIVMINSGREDGLPFGINLNLASIGAIIKLVENSGSSRAQSVY
jgi:hypothetical protein